MKRVIIIFSLISLIGCGYRMYYTKSITPVPSDISRVKVMEIKDVNVVTQYGKQTGMGDFIRITLLSELGNSKHFVVDEDARHHLTLKIESYRPGYRKYVALTAQILDSSTNKVAWSAAISGVSKKFIDKVIKNVVKELVKEMEGIKK